MKAIRRKLGIDEKSIQLSLTSDRQVNIPLMDRNLIQNKSYMRNINQRFSNPSKNKLYKLNDASHVVSLKKVQKLQKICEFLDQKFRIILPQSIIYFVWNLLLLIAILFNFFEIPVSLFLTQRVYHDQFNNPVFIFLNVFFLLIIFGDMIFVLPNMAYYEHGQLIIQRYKILKRYFKWQFYLDVLSFIILLTYISGNESKLIYFKIFFYIKIFSLNRVDRIIIDYLELNKIIFSMYRFFRISIILIFLIVWIASIYFAIDYSYYMQKGYYYNTNQLWLYGSPSFGALGFPTDVIQTFQWPYWLVYAMYWTLQITATIGYGQITARNPITILYSGFVMILMTVLFALFINTVWDIINTLQESSRNYSQNWSSLNSLLSQKKISKKLNDKVSSYFHQVWKYNDNHISSLQIDQNLSQSLKDQLYSLSTIQLFNNIPLFVKWQKQHPQQWSKFKILIFNSIETIQLAQDQILTDNQSITNYQQNQGKIKSFNCNMYCILKGKINLTVKSNQIYKDNQCIFKRYDKFGQEQFFLERPAKYIAKAQTFTRLSKIQRHKFISIIKKFPKLYYSFINEIENLKYQQDRQIIGSKCWFCYGASLKIFYHSPYNCRVNNQWRRKLIVRNDQLNISIAKKLHMNESMDYKNEQKKQQKVLHYRNLIVSKKIKNIKLCDQIDMDKIDKDNFNQLLMANQKNKQF